MNQLTLSGYDVSQAASDMGPPSFPARRLTMAAAVLAMAGLFSGCSTLSQLKLPALKIPSVHKISIQQGNVITQDMVDQLRPGMSKLQVIFVMGEPVVRNPFRHDRWEYIYTMKIPGREILHRRVTLSFEQEELSRLDGDFADPDLRRRLEESKTGDAEGKPAEGVPESSEPADLNATATEDATDDDSTLANPAAPPAEKADNTKVARHDAL